MRRLLDPLVLAVAGHAAAITFILSARTKDLVSPPAIVDSMAVARPFAFGRCVPLTTVLQDEMVVSFDEAYGQPVYRCTGWLRPLLKALLAAFAAALLILALRLGLRLSRRNES